MGVTEWCRYKTCVHDGSLCYREIGPIACLPRLQPSLIDGKPFSRLTSLPPPGSFTPPLSKSDLFSVFIWSWARAVGTLACRREKHAVRRVWDELRWLRWRHLDRFPVSHTLSLVPKFMRRHHFPRSWRQQLSQCCAHRKRTARITTNLAPRPLSTFGRHGVDRLRSLVSRISANFWPKYNGMTSVALTIGAVTGCQVR